MPFPNRQFLGALMMEDIDYQLSQVDPEEHHKKVFFQRFNSLCRTLQCDRACKECIGSIYWTPQEGKKLTWENVDSFIKKKIFLEKLDV